jgi:hypothetical protein
MLINGTLFFGFALNVIKKVKAIYYLSIFYISLNLILTLTDQFGFFDLIVLIVNALTLIFLYLSRKHFLKY